MNKSRGKRWIGALALGASLGLAGVVHADGGGISTRQAASADETQADAPTAGAMAFDLILVRPLGIAATAIGTGLFIANLPFSIFEKDAPAQPFRQLVVAPARYTFTRPLGAMK